ncbi:MAG: FAD-binding oxidoreductase [Opitutaceae bacterium]|nr:FAD-binding oxidoreductase [Opitutaceae bacterium]
MSVRTVVIIGGGVTGLSTAYQLARRQYGRIVVLEKDRVGAGSSSRAAGITTGLLWSETGVQARQIGLGLFRELSRTLPGYHYHDEHGCLNLFSPALWPDRERLLPLYDRLGAPYRVLSAAEICRRWPCLRPPPDFLGLHDPAGGYSEPPEYLRALERAVRGLGVEIREQTTVTGFRRDQSGAVTGVRTAAGELPADAVVATVYVWTLPTLAPLGLRLPVKHFVHQRYVSAPLSSPPAFPPVNADPYGGYVRPAAGGRLLLGVETAERTEWRVNTVDFRMIDLAAPAGLRESTVERFRPFLPELGATAWESSEVGLISFSMDGEPILGPVAAAPGLFVGLAFHSGGFSYNPVSGLLLAELVSTGRTSIDIAAFSPDRFSAPAADAYLASVVPQKHAVRRRH